MTGFDQLIGGFAVALSWKGLLYCFIGCLWGTIVGVLPGLGPLAGMTLLLPLTFGLDPSIGIIMLTGIFYGAMYGGSTTSILVRIPGEAASVVTCIDGYEMARQGRAGPALAIAAISSFFAGCVSTVLVAALGAPLTSVALLFGPAEYFSLMVLGLVFVLLVCFLRRGLIGGNRSGRSGADATRSGAVAVVKASVTGAARTGGAVNTGSSDRAPCR